MSAEESLCLTNLLEVMQLIEDCEEEIVTVEAELGVADTSAVTKDLEEKMEKEKEKLQIIKTKEGVLKQRTRDMLSDDVQTVTEEEPEPEVYCTTPQVLFNTPLRGSTILDTHPPTNMSTTFKFKLPPPEKFKRGDNFSRFCENFRDYVKLAALPSTNLNIYFLTLLDSFTKEKLKSVSLSTREKSSAELFTAAYISKMTPRHEAESLKLKLLDEKQRKGESIEDFAFRLTEISRRAHSNTEEPSRKSACYSTFLKGLMNKDIRIRLREDRHVTDFDTAVEEAVRLHDIRDSEGHTTVDPDARTETDIGLWNINDTDNKTGRSSSSFKPRDRTRSPARESRVRFSPEEKNNPSNGQKQRFNRQPIICYKCNGHNHFARNCMARF